MKLSIEHKIILGFCSLGLFASAIPQLGYVANIGSAVESTIENLKPADRIITAPNPIHPQYREMDIEVNCTQVLLNDDGEWKSPDDYSSPWNYTLEGIIKDACD